MSRFVKLLNIMRNNGASLEIAYDERGQCFNVALTGHGYRVSDAIFAADIHDGTFDLEPVFHRMTDAWHHGTESGRKGKK